jgi:hypothetical protein
MITKKAQEEMVGFVLIVVIVAIIGLIFLGIMLNKPNNIPIQRSELLDSFIKSISTYTTDCQSPQSYYLSIDSLIVGCYNNGQCADNRIECDVLNSTLSEILKASYKVTNDSYIKYYELKIESGDNSSLREIIPRILSGVKTAKCPGTKVFNERFLNSGAGGELIRLRLEICYNNLNSDNNV